MFTSFYQQFSAMLARQWLKVTVYAVLLQFFLPYSAWAGFNVRNVTPFAQGVGLPELKDGRLLPHGQQQLLTQVLWSNQFYEGSNDAENLLVDGESLQLDFFYRYRFNAVELAINVPFIRYSGGTMDNFIEFWHDTFNLPNGGRENYKSDRLNFYYQTDSERYETMDDYEGVGDVRLSVAVDIFSNESQASALYIYLKLPTADSIWLSSGGTDAGIGLSHQFDSGRWHQQLQYAVTYLGQGDWLEEDRRSVALSLHVGLSYLWSDALSFLIQVDGHSALFENSSEKPLGNAAILTAGFQYAWDEDKLKIGLVEDIAPDTAPDVGFVFSYEVNF